MSGLDQNEDVNNIDNLNEPNTENESNGSNDDNDSNNDEPSENELDDSNNENELDSNDSNNDNESNNEEPLENELNDTPAPQPWENAPSDCLFYEKIYDDGHLGSFTQSAELAYKMGWDIEHNYILIADTEQSDINGWTYRKEVCPRKTQEQLNQETVNKRIVEIQNAVQKILDDKAKEKLYDNGFAIASYATSTKESFRTEAQRFVAWRDDVWSKCYEILADFQSGEIDMPSVEYVIERLPVLNWDSGN